MESSDKTLETANHCLVVLIGPTGVGKTEAALKLASRLNTPIINADSRQIFKEIPIGTAAPTDEQQRLVRHYFVANHSITDYYSASIYEEECMQLIGRLFSGEEDGIPHSNVILSGGSMMYIDAVCRGIDDIPTINDDIRNKMKQRLAKEGLPALVEELRALDPEHWAIVDRNNPRRVVHALEICHQTGRTYTSFRTNSIKERPFRIIKIGINRQREEMYERINARVLKMVDDGLVDEVMKMYQYRDLNALNTVGYKEMFDYLDGLITLDEAIRQIQSNTRRYMRKQLTWFKRDPSIRWFELNNKEENVGNGKTNIEEILNYIDNLTT